MYQPIGTLLSGCSPMVSATNPGKVIHKYGMFEFEEDLNNSPWFVPIPFKFTHPVNPLPHKFKNHFPLFHGDGTITVIEHLHAFSNACTILGINNNDSCMLLFMNSLPREMSPPYLSAFLMDAYLPGLNFLTGLPLPLGIWIILMSILKRRGLNDRFLSLNLSFELLRCHNI
jgi:hypothetical protein